MNSAHQYDRTFVGNESDNSLLRLAAWVPLGSTVLELGPASGYFTKHLSQTLGCTVDAIERDPTMAEMTRPFCRGLVVGDLDHLVLLEQFPGRQYDVIIAADIIEHLVWPERLLAQIAQCLTVQGRLLISVPNAAYAGLVASLLDGKFDYREEGILDRTHLRFFTRDSLSKLLLSTGFHPKNWAPVFRPLNESEFKIRLEALPAGLRDALVGSPYAFAYQWVVDARTEGPAQAIEEPPPCHHDAFPLRIFYRNRSEVDTSDREILCWGNVGMMHQVLHAELPALDLAHIRLTLADRPGYVRLYCVRIIAPSGVALWSWQSADGISALSELHDHLWLAQSGDHVLVTLEHSQSWLLLNLGDLALPTGSQIVIELGWPMSADYCAALGILNAN